MHRGAVRDDIAEMVAAVEPRRDRCLMQNADRTAAVASAFDPLGYADRARQSAVAKAAQLTVDQVIRDQPGVNWIMAKRRHRRAPRDDVPLESSAASTAARIYLRSGSANT